MMKVETHILAVVTIATALAIAPFTTASALDVLGARNSDINANIEIGSSADINATPQADDHDASISATGKPVRSNASKQFGMKSKSTLRARNERNYSRNDGMTRAERDQLRMDREDYMRRHPDRFEAQGTASTPVGTTETVGDARVGIGSNLGMRVGGGTRR